MRRISLLTVLTLLPFFPLSSSAQTSECDGNFHVVHRELGHVALSDVDFAESEGWAVGFDYAEDEEGNEIGNERPLVLRFDDNSVEKVNPPHDPTESFSLQGVAAIADDDVHAVGISYGRPSRRDSHEVGFHWDGTAWEQLEMPSPGRQSWLFGVSAVAPDDIWAVGEYETRGDALRTLILHYDGSTWSKVPSPSPRGYVKILNDVDGTSSSDAWAVGSFTDRAADRERPLLLRWNGTEWKRRRLALEFPKSQKLLGIDVVSADDIWVVGAGRRHRPLVLHFDGTKWSKSELPDSRGWERLNDVAGTVAQVWTAGSSAIRRPYETSIPLAARSVGGEWQHASYEGDDYGDFEGITLDDTGAAWVVGETFDPEGTQYGDVIEKACAP